MKLVKILRSHKFEAYLIAFILMIAPPLPMYFAARQENWWLFGIELGIVVIGNLLALLI
jgi:hypothetical protein